MLIRRDLNCEVCPIRMQSVRTLKQQKHQRKLDSVKSFALIAFVWKFFSSDLITINNGEKKQ
jgi:hypothetical protein